MAFTPNVLAGALSAAYPTDYLSQYGKLLDNYGVIGYNSPALDLFFSNGLNVLDPRISFTRSSLATVTRPNGFLDYCDHNLLTYSQLIGGTSWSNYQVGVATNAATAPDGTLTASSVIATAQYGNVSKSVSVSANTTYTYSAWVRVPAGSTSLVYQSYDGTSYNNVSLNVGSAWTRVTKTITTGASATSLTLQFIDNSSSSWVGIQVWGAQLELANSTNTPRQYVPTTSSAVYGVRFDYNAAGTPTPNGVELVTNGNFSSSSNWTLGAGWSIAGGMATKTAGSGTELHQSGLSLTPGATYAITYTLAGVTAGSVGARLSYNDASAFATGAYHTTNGTYTDYLVALATENDIGFAPNAAFAGSVTLVSVQQCTFPALGVLIEESRTNLLTYSNNFTNAAWQVFSGATITGGGSLGPDGTASYTLGLGSTAAALRQGPALAAGSTAAIAIYARSSSSGGASNVRLTTNSQAAWNTGISQKFALTYQWQRLTTSGVVNAGNGAVYFLVGRVDASGSDDATCAGNVDIAYADLQVGSFITSTIPTTSSAGTRAADVASVATSSFGFNAAQGTFVAQAQAASLSNSPGSFGTSPGGCGFNDAISILHWWNGSVNTNCPTTVSAGAFYKEGISYTASSIALCGNGGSVTNSAVAPWGTTPTQINIGTPTGSSQFLNGHIARLTYYPRALSAAQLQGLTT